MLISIGVAVIAAFVVIFVIVLIPLLLQARKTAKEAERILEAARQQIVPLSHELVRIVDDIHDIVRQGKSQMDKVEDGVNAVRDAALKLRDIESTLKNRVEKPFLDLITLLAALVKGTRAFLDYMKREQ